MGWRVVAVSSISKLDYKLDYLVIRTKETISRIHLSEISVLMIESTAVSLTSYLLVELGKQKIDVIFCDEHRFPFARFQPLYGSHNTSEKVREQVLWTSENKNAIWQKIVFAKIIGQSSVLKRIGNEEGYKALLEFSREVTPGDTTNREGHAAKVYFNRLFGMNFTRTDKDNAINSALNYGYSLLLSIVAREVVSNGYLTQLGIHHDNMFNDLNLACDFMEPFRPFIDLLCAKMNPEAFGKDQKLELIGFMNRQIIIAGKQQYMLNAIEIYVKSLFISLETGDSSLIKFPEYEFPIYESTGIL